MTTGKQRTLHILSVVARSMCLCLLLVALFASVFHGQASADRLNSRSLRIGSVDPSATTTHEFSFTYSGTNSVGSVTFQYCLDPIPSDPCTAPTGVDVSGVTLTSQTGETNFSLYSATANQIVISRPSAPAAATASDYLFSNAVNPSVKGTFFVRISTYASNDGTGTAQDAGSVASSINQSISISTEVPQILKFCVGVTIGNDCSSAQGSFIQLGDLTSDNTAAGTSQFWVGTNAPGGFSVVTSGTSMTSGNNTISPLAQPTESAAGNTQFGLNLRANSNPGIGADPTGPGDAQPAPNYNVPNTYMFEPGGAVVQDASATNDRKFTVSYIVNVSPDQPPGVYSTTITYVCSATF
ncbi:MAG TPA: hypothetical protein VHT70_04520 [Candidatus Saccharimonadales bacterium]|jgi:hypothetical protein|nr:hypothetical protein [Candidatus Saccharimonadales bacterium]